MEGKGGKSNTLNGKGVNIFWNSKMVNMYMVQLDIVLSVDRALTGTWIS